MTAELGERLLTDGFCVVRDAFPPRYLRQLRDEMRAMHDRGLLYPNSTHILTGGGAQGAQTLLLEKHHILETELADASDVKSTHTPCLRDFYDSQVVFGPLQCALPDWLGLVGHMCKLQYNEGSGACFPMHFDSYGHDGKCVTAVLYLNEDWQDGDGGEIVLYPFPKERVVLQPRFGELVLFSSQQMLHRVLPASASRFALTTWVYCDPQVSNSPDNSKARSEYYQSNEQVSESEFLKMMKKVLQSPFRRHLARLLCDEEWQQSLRESHNQTAEFEEYMNTQKREIRLIQDACERMLSNFRSSALKHSGSTGDLPTSLDELETRMRSDQDFHAFVAQFQFPWF